MEEIEQVEPLPQTPTTKVRHRVLTIFLVLSFIFTSMATLTNLLGSSTIAASLPQAPSWVETGVFSIGLLGILGLGALTALWNWQRWGAYLYLLVFISTFFLNMLILGGVMPLFGLLGGLTLLYLVSRQWCEFE